MADSVSTVCVAVRDALQDLFIGDGVLVACSGGPDSLALAAAVARLSGRYGWRAGSVTVDHGWSAAASAASVEAVRVCRSLGLSAELVTVRPDGAGGPEAAAREARYAALSAAAERFGARAVLLGHTRDDQAETVLLGLARGSGARSLAGMPARRDPYRRPFLGLSRSATVAACAELGLTPWLDPANSDPAYLRVRVRNLAGELEAALGPGVAAALARTADLLRADADALDAYAEALLADATTPGPRIAPGSDPETGSDPGPISPAEPPPGGEAPGSRASGVPNHGFDVRVLLAAPAAVRRRALLAAAREAGCPGGALSHRHALALEGLLTGPGGGATDLPGGVRGVLRGDELVFTRADG